MSENPKGWYIIKDPDAVAFFVTYKTDEGHFLPLSRKRPLLINDALELSGPYPKERQAKLAMREVVKNYLKSPHGAPAG